MVNSTTNIWCDEIYPYDFRDWWYRDGGTSTGYDWLVRHLAVRLIKGKGIEYRDRGNTTVFCGGTTVKLTTDFAAMMEEAIQDKSALSRESVSKLQQYTEQRLPMILESRKKELEKLERKHTFLATTKHPQSTSAALGQVEVTGVLKLILDFAVGEPESRIPVKWIMAVRRCSLAWPIEASN